MTLLPLRPLVLAVTYDRIFCGGSPAKGDRSEGTCNARAGAELWSWLQWGAHFYVCGDASRMATDVDRALREICAEHGRLSSEQAQSYLKQLAVERRYVRDVY